MAERIFMYKLAKIYIHKKHHSHVNKFIYLYLLDLTQDLSE